MSEIWNLSTLCRCCHADGNFRNLREAYVTLEGVETYEILLRDVFGIVISVPPFEASYNICDRCITKLEDASSFKKQATVCEEKFEVYCKNEQFIQNSVKEESSNSDHNIEWDNNILPLENVSAHKKEFKIEVDLGSRVSIKEEEEEDEKPQPETNTQQNKFNSIEKKKKRRRAKTKVKTDHVPAGDKDRTPESESHSDSTAIVESEIDGKTVFSCKSCGGTHADWQAAHTHVEQCRKQKYKCQECDRQFSRRNLYSVHIRSHRKQPKLYRCEYCCKDLSSAASLRDHINSHTKVRQYSCQLCNKRYIYKNSLKVHLQWHDGVRKKVLCDLCGRSFNDETNLNIHIKVVHFKIRSFACDICGKTYTAKKHLKAHILAHMRSASGGAPAPEFTCRTCRKQFKCARSFEVHVLLHDDKFQCRACRWVSGDRESYLRHLRTHSKAVSCPVCGKQFTTTYAMRRHVDAHDGVKRFACDICGLKLAGKAQVKRHVSRRHGPGAPRVQCQLCKRHVTDIHKHMEGHRHKKYSCEYCGKSYVENNALTRHMTVIHFGRVFTCDICNKNYMSMKSVTRHKMKVHKVMKSETEEGVGSNQTEMDPQKGAGAITVFEPTEYGNKT